MQRIQGSVQKGNTKVATGGQQSSTLVQGSFPGATVTVFAEPPVSVNITSITRAANVVTATLATSPGFIAGQQVTIAGVTDGSFNGTFTITSCVGPTLVFSQTAGNASSSGGTATSLTIASIYSDNVGTPLTNPFTADSIGNWGFFAPNGAYDAQFSGTGISSPFTISSLRAFDESIIWADVQAAPYFAKADGIADDTNAWKAAFATSKNVIIPPGRYKISSTIPFQSGQNVIAFNMPSRWRSGVAPVLVNYVGTGALFSITPPVSTPFSSIYLSGLHLDGSGASGAVDGILFDASAASSDVEGIVLEDCTITNFPQHQVHSKETVFDVTFRRCTIHNSGRPADNTVQITYTGAAGLGAPGQWTFDDSWIIPYTADKWSVFAGRNGSFPINAITELRFKNGTIAPAANGNGSHGVWVYGGLHISGTHIQNAQEAAQPNTIGIRYTGSNGGFIAPSICSFFGTGLEIGDSSTPITDAEGCVVMCGVGFNLTAGRDINIVGTGIRRGTVIFPQGSFTIGGAFGTATGIPNISNNAANPGDVLIIQSTTSPGGFLTVGKQIYMDDNNQRIGLGVSPAVRLHIRTPHNDGIRIENTSNLNRMVMQLLADGSDLGQILLYDAAQNPKIILTGSGTSSFSGVMSLAAQMQSSLATGTPPFSIVSTTPVPNLTASPLARAGGAGSQLVNAHIEVGTVTLAGGVATVTLSGTSVFSNSGSYVVLLTNFNSSTNPSPKVTILSGTQFSIAGVGVDSFYWVAIGN